MNYQSKQSIASLLQATWAQISNLDLGEAKADEIQEYFDKVLSVVNDKLKDTTPPSEVVSVDKDRKTRREKEKRDKGKKDKDAVPVESTPDKAEVAKSSKPKRNKRASA